MSTGLPVIPTPYIHSSIKRRKNTWYSISDGNWSSASTWISNGTKRYAYPGQNIHSPVFPQVGDDVYINTNVTADVNVIINNLRVSGYLTFAGLTSISVNGDIQATGTVDMIGFNSNLILYGVNNSVTNLIGGAGTVTYANPNKIQPVVPMGYNNLTISGYYNIAAGDIVTKGTLLINTFFNLATFNLETGICMVSNAGTFSKPSGGNMIFNGVLTTGAGKLLDFSGNPNIEFRGGLSQGWATNQNYGQGNVTITTNNQTFYARSSTSSLPNVTVVGNITVTFNSQDITAGYRVLSINGTDINSKIILNNARFTLLSSSNLVPMVTGIFDRTTYSNQIGYATADSCTLPYTDYIGLYTEGASKNLLGNTTISETLTVNDGYLECGTFDLTVGGSSTGYLSKGGAGNLLFIGFCSMFLDLPGNPDIEFRGGLNPILINSGSGLWKFTSSQSLGVRYTSFTVNATISIDSGVILTIGTGTSSNYSPILLAQVIGGGTLRNRLISGIYPMSVSYSASLQPLCILDCSTYPNEWKYTRSGDQEVKGTTYSNLTFGGSGIKKLMGNVVVNTTAGGSWSITGTATIDYNGFTITTI